MTINPVVSKITPDNNVHRDDGEEGHYPFGDYILSSFKEDKDDSSSQWFRPKTKEEMRETLHSFGELPPSLANLVQSLLDNALDNSTED